MFDSDRNVLLFSTFVAIVIIGSIVEGYLLHDQVTMTLDNWQSIIIGRLFLHLIGILPFLIFIGMMMESMWKSVAIGIVLLTAMNYNPIRDLLQGPIHLKDYKIEHWSREVYNHPSSDVDFSTHDVPMIKLIEKDKSVLLTEDRWNGIIENCNGQQPISYTGLEHLEVELEWECSE